MVIEEKILHGVCLTAHPTGCKQYTEDEIAFVEDACKGLKGDRYTPFEKKPLKVLVLGCSTGYGLSTRIVQAFANGSDTLGVSYERSPKANKSATPGWYNIQVFEQEAKKRGLYAKTLNGDAFSFEMKEQVANLIKTEMGGHVDLVVYSLASPVRLDPTDGKVYKSVLKPIGEEYSNLTLNVSTGMLEKVTIAPATEEQVEATVKVMGGEDWALWIDYLLKENCLAHGAKTVAYSYIGPQVTVPIYRHGTIGQAKAHLEHTIPQLNEKLAAIDGKAFVSVNKALITRASAVIPVVPLYTAILYRVMKEKGLHEDCIDQMYRLYHDKFANETVESDGLIHMDDFEMREDVQQEIEDIWTRLKEGELFTEGNLEEFKTYYSHLHGFGYPQVDYTQDVNPLEV